MSTVNINMKEAKVISSFCLEDTPPSTIRFYWMDIISDGMNNSIRVPLMVARGQKDSPVLGLTAAVHGNELNGISVIQRLFSEIDVKALNGTIVGVPIVNIPSFIRKKRRFNDGVDLNHIMPGLKDGNVSQVYAYRFFDRIVKHVDFLLDLHTASSGRVNSYYVRADMNHSATKKMALLQNAQIIVHNPPSDGTLRGAADEINIPAITLEVGNPNTFQKKMIKSGIIGVHNILSYLEMTDDKLEITENTTIFCDYSYWIYTDIGGLLTVYSELTQSVKKGDLIASVRNVFGTLIKEYFAPEAGVIIGKSVSPVNQTGGRIVHLGIIQKQT